MIVRAIFRFFIKVRPGIIFPGFTIDEGKHVGTFRSSDGVMMKDILIKTNDRITDFDIDSLYNYYLIGTFQSDSMRVGTQTIYHINSNLSIPELVIFKIDSTGTTKWYKHFGDSVNFQTLKGGSILHDLDGTILISATTQNNISYDGLFSNNAANNFGQYPMIAKLDSNGHFLWIANPTVQYSGEISYGLAKRKNGNIIFSGLFTGFATFGTDTFTSNPPQDLFMSEVSPTGQILNGTQFSTTGSSEIINCIVVDSSDQIYVGGAFDGTFTLGGQSYLCQGGNGDCFIAKYGLQCVTGINSLEASASQIKITPNPASEIIHIISSRYNIHSLEIYNGIGQLVLRDYNVNNNNYTVNISSFTDGLYIVRTKTENGISNARFIKE